jgi:predicted methyltransferase
MKRMKGWIGLGVWIGSVAVGMGQVLDAADRMKLAVALAHPDRPAEDRQRDIDRKPEQVLEFFSLRPGMKVADLMAGGGYYTEILSRYLGKEGTVYAQNNAIALRRFAADAMDRRLNGRDLDNVVRVDRELEDPGLPEGELDAVIMGLFYHDAYWMGVDREAMNRAIFKALKPGGTYGVFDHHAEAGSRDRDVESLHRVDAEMVRREIRDAGFEWFGAGDMLRNRDDDRTQNVFDPAIRGKTDRFVFRFRKPVEKAEGEGTESGGVER